MDPLTLKRFKKIEQLHQKLLCHTFFNIINGNSRNLEVVDVQNVLLITTRFLEATCFSYYRGFVHTCQSVSPIYLTLKCDFII